MTEPAHILVVDDDASIRRMMQLLLSDAGYRVSTAASGEETLSYLDLVTPDLILLDFMLPGISGRDVAQQIKSNRQHPFIPIILVTARSDSASKVSGLDAGADDYLSKPVEFPELLARVRALLRLQRSQRSLQAEQRKTELLLHLARELSTTLDIDEMLTHFLEKLAEAIGAVRASIILTLGGQTRFYSSSRYETSIALNDILDMGAAGWVLREKQSLNIGDTQDDTRWINTNSFHAGIRSVAITPIMREGSALGVITVVHHTPNYFTDEHLDLLASVAQQSAFTLENAELYRLTRSQKELLEWRAEELQRLNEVSRHLTELMQPDLLVRLVSHLIHYTFRYPQVTIFLRDDNNLAARALAGDLYGDELLNRCLPAGVGITGWVMTNRQLLNVADVREDPRYVAPKPNDAVRSELAVPIFAGRELFGVLDVTSTSPGAFGANDERLLGTLASQIGVALDNARLFETEKRRVRQLGQVNSLSVAITAQLDLPQNLQIAADALTAIFGVERSAIVVYTDQNMPGTWVASAGSNPQAPKHYIDQVLLQRDESDGVVQEALLVPDIARDERFARYRPLLQGERIESVALAPLVSGGRRIGTVILDVSGRTEHFAQAELTLLATVASLIGQVMENARLYRAVEDERGTLDAVLDGAADPILLIGPQNQLLLSNRAAAEQLNISEATGQRIDALIREPELLEALDAQGNNGSREVTVNGTTFSISVATVQGGQNDFLGRVAVLQDITAIKELERREQERLRGALRRYVSPQVVEQMLTGGSDFGTPVERDVVVLFADLRGYTALTEGIPARVLVEQVLNRYFTAMTAQLYRYEGTVDKFLGDGIIGVFGTPIAHADDLPRSILAAVDMQRSFNRLRDEWNATLKLDIGMGIGIGYGRAVVGNIGSTQRTDFTLIGDVVNTTSRLSGLAQPGQIIVSHQLVSALPHDWRSPFPLHEMGQVSLKGKQDPHLIYEIEYQAELRHA